MRQLSDLKRFLIALALAIGGGSIWATLNLPLGWLLGAAVTTGALAVSGWNITVYRLPHRAGMIMIGSSVGLSLTPEVASQFTSWLPIMVIAAFLGIITAALVAPLLARFGRIGLATAYFSLLPGGVIEMAEVGAGYGADRTTIATLHAFRLALVAGVLPLVIFSLSPDATGTVSAAALISLPELCVALTVGAVGSLVGSLLRLPAAWLLGAVLSVGVFAGAGTMSGRMPPELLAGAQVFVGMSLGARFERKRLATIPRAILIGVIVLSFIMALMAGVAAIVALVMDRDISTLVLAFSIGGMAEMVLTAKALQQDVALVAAFQALRGVMVNVFAGTIWRIVKHNTPERKDVEK